MAISVLQITGSNGLPVITLNYVDKSIIFNHKTIELEIKNGISIPPFLREKFQGKSKIHRPSKGSKEGFELFARAIKYYHEQKLARDGFRLSIHSIEHKT